jgi:sugar phosphate permease
MRLGFSEVITILVVLCVIVVIARMFRGSHSPSKKSDNGSSRNTRYEKTSSIWSRLRRVGIAFILAGAVFLFAAIGMFKWAFQSYMWSFIAVIIGFAMVLLSRNK